MQKLKGQIAVISILKKQHEKVNQSISDDNYNFNKKIKYNLFL